MDEKHFPVTFQIKVKDKTTFNTLIEAIKTDYTSGLVHEDSDLVRARGNTIEIGYNYHELQEVHPMLNYQITELKLVTERGRKAFQDALGTLEYKHECKLLENSLFEHAAHTASHFNYDANPIPKVVLAEDTPGDQIVAALNHSCQGVVILESHDEGKARSFIINNLESFKKSGGDTIYLEHLRPEYQRDVDQFLHTGEMSKKLESYLNRTDRELTSDDPGRLINVLKAAQSLGLRVIGIDSIHAKPLNPKSSSFYEERAMLMNQYACNVINTTKGTGNFMVLAGEAHGHTHPGGIPGLCQLLGVPALTVSGKGKTAVIAAEDPANRAPGEILTHYRQGNRDAHTSLTYNEAIGVIGALCTDGTKKQALHDELKGEVRSHLVNKKDTKWRNYIEERDVNNVISKHTDGTSLSYEERIIIQKNPGPSSSSHTL